MAFRFDIGDRVSCRGHKGTIVGLVTYPDSKDGSIMRQEYQVSLEAAGGSGAVTHFAEEEVQGADDQR